MAFRPQESEVNDLNNPCENSEQKPSIPLSVYANKLGEKVKKRYVEKISAIGIDPVWIEGKNFEPDCLTPVESTDLLLYLVLGMSVISVEIQTEGSLGLVDCQTLLAALAR